MAILHSVLFELATDLLCVVDRDGVIRQVNAAWEASLGWATTDVEGRDLLSLIHPDDRPRTEGEMARLRKLGRLMRFDCRVLRKDGACVWFSWSAGVLEGEGVVFAIGRDIGTLKEKALFFDEMQRVAAIGSWRWETAGGAQKWSDEAYRILGWPDGTALTWESVQAVIAPEGREALARAFHDAKAKGKSFDLELALTTGGASPPWLRVIGHPLWEKGAIIELYGIIQDVSRQREAADAIVHLKNQYERMIARLEEAVWEADVGDGRLLFASPAQTRALLGYDVDELKADPSLWFRIVVDEDKPMATAMQRHALVEGRVDATLRVRHKDGGIRWIRNRFSVDFDAQGRPTRVFGIASDVTRAKENDRMLEAQRASLAHSAKMSSLGEMASSIAHEINNPLAIIQGKANLMQKRLAANLADYPVPDLVADLAKIEATSNRIAKIVRGLRGISRPADKDPFRPVALAGLVDDVLGLCQERFRASGIALRVTIEGGDASVECRGTQIGQVLLNLLNNAHDAVSALPDPWVEIHGHGFGETVRLVVRDAGRGIPADVAARIMQPFFTTKEAGKGTGLGLSISKSIVEDHGGRLGLDATATHTTFVVELPRRQSVGKPAAASLSVPWTPRTR